MKILAPWVALCGLLAVQPAQANTFGNREVPSDRIVAVASPYGEGQHQLLVIQQLNGSRQCWGEFGASPVQIDPLLVNFDFTGVCGRSIDSNGYSVRLGNQDMGWRYSLRIVKQDGDMLLMGAPTGNKTAPELTIGRVGGAVDGFAKIQLNPGWRMTQRTYMGDTLGHIYFTHDQPLTAFTNAPPNAPETGVSTSRVPANATPTPTGERAYRIETIPGQTVPTELLPPGR
jgi:N-acetylmuramoyl-L-alanine amidase